MAVDERNGTRDPERALTSSPPIPPSSPTLRSRTRSQTALFGVAVLSLGIACGTYVVAPQLVTAEQAAADALPPAAQTVTASVEKRVLTEEAVLRGVVSAGNGIAVLPTAALTATAPVVTALPAAAGSSIVSGTPVAEANGEPVFAVDWDFAPYRDIIGGSRGPDVVQLQDTLAELGYATSVNGVLDRPTQSGLQAFYADRGYTVPVTAGSSTPETTADAEPTAAAAEAAAEPYLPAASLVLIPSGLHTVSRVLPHVGSYLTESAHPLLTLDVGENIAVAVVDAGIAVTYSPGDRAVLTDDRDGSDHPLTVSSVGTEPEEVAGVGNGIKVVFGFTGDAPAPTPADSTVLISVTLAGDPEPLNAVPVTALYSRGDGTSFVTVVPDPGTGKGSREVTVKAGRDVGGWVAVEPRTPDELAVGSDVVVGISHGQ